MSERPLAHLPSLKRIEDPVHVNSYHPLLPISVPPAIHRPRGQSLHITLYVVRAQVDCVKPVLCRLQRGGLAYVRYGPIHVTEVRYAGLERLMAI